MILSVARYFAVLATIACSATPAAALQGSPRTAPARIAIVLEARFTAYTYRDQLRLGGDAAGFGLTVQGPAWHGIRPWAAATSVDFDIGCIEISGCENEGHVFRAGALFDMGAIYPVSPLQPYVGLGIGFAKRGPRYESWIFAPNAGVVLRLSQHLGIRGGISWGERPLRDRVWTVDGGFRIDLLH